MVRWTREHEQQRQAILVLLRVRAKPFADTSDTARAARRALPFAAWCRAYLPHYFSAADAPFHRIADDAVEETGIPVTMCWGRGWGKSTRYNTARGLWKILMRPCAWHFLIIGSRAEDVAAAHADYIRLELEHNERIHADYGNGEPIRCDGPAEDYVALDTRVWARGIGQSVRGQRYRQYRPDAFCGDDLEDDILARSPDREAALRDWLFANVWPAMEADSSFLVLLTPYRRGCLSAHMREMAGKTDTAGRALARYILISAEDARGESSWPARRSTADLRRTAAIVGMRIYRREYLCQEDNEESPFWPEWFKEFSVLEADRVALRVVAYLDASAGAAESNDFKALIVLGFVETPFGRFPAGAVLCLHAWIRHASPQQMVDELYRAIEHSSPGVSGCEANGFQCLIWPILALVARQRKREIALRPITNTQNKGDRILSNQPEFERGACWFDAGEGDQRLLINQFLDFGQTGVHDDGPDAWDGARRLLPRTVGASEFIYRGERREADFGALVGAGAATERWAA